MSGNKAIISLVLLTLTTLGGFSVMGIIQSSERLGTSGIIVRNSTAEAPPVFTPYPLPPEPNVNIDVYQDSGCNTILSEVVWGTIIAGGRSNAQMYVKNNGDVEVILSLASDNWSPVSASDYMSLSWDYDGQTLQPGEVVGITLSLDTSASCPEYSNFGFDIVVIGS
jgi:hypothetical protein